MYREREYVRKIKRDRSNIDDEEREKSRETVQYRKDIVQLLDVDNDRDNDPHCH